MSDVFDVICDGVADRIRRQSREKSLVSVTPVSRHCGHCSDDCSNDCSDDYSHTQRSERLGLVSPGPASPRLHRPASVPWPDSLFPLAFVSQYKVRISSRFLILKSDSDSFCA